MNKEYIYIDQKAIILDENGAKNPINYYNELDKTLEQENLIETMEQKIDSLEKSKKNINIITKLEIIWPIVIGIIVPIILTIMCSIIGYGQPYNAIVNTMFGPMKSGIASTIIMTIFCETLGIAFSSEKLIEHLQNKRKLKGIEYQLEYLKKNIIKEQEKLEELNRNKNYEHENKNFRMVKINNETIKNLNYKLKLYYSCGYNGKKYYKYYKKHKQLPKELIEMFKNGEIEIIKEFLEEKGPQLIKRK